MSRHFTRFATRRIAAVLAAATLTAPLAVGFSTQAAMAATVDRTMPDARINESSGLTFSTRFAGAVITHNDSGDGNRVFVVGRDGQTKAVWTLQGARSWDWEDIASTPDHTIWVGDIGDNFLRKDSQFVFAFTEPTSLRDATVRPTAYEFVYPDGRSHNAEALMVRPTNNRILIVTKSKAGGAIYRFPANPSSTRPNVLEYVAPAPSTITAGAVAPSGGGFVLRSYSAAYVYDTPTSDPRRFPLPSLGESVTYGPSSTSEIFSGSEGVRSNVWRVPIN
jgi:hypothetical protein